MAVVVARWELYGVACRSIQSGDAVGYVPCSISGPGLLLDYLCALLVLLLDPWLMEEAPMAGSKTLGNLLPLADPCLLRSVVGGVAAG